MKNRTFAELIGMIVPFGVNMSRKIDNYILLKITIL